MPTQDAFGQGFTALDYGDVPDLKVMGDGLLKMAGQTVMVFASASARNGTLKTPKAGMVAYLADAKQLTVYDGANWVAFYNSTEVTTTGAVAAGSFSISTFIGRRTLGVCSITVEVTRTGSKMTATGAGNVDDTLLCALPAGWRPANNTGATAGSGYGDGEVRIETDGQIYLRSWSSGGSIDTGDTIRISSCYVL